MSQFTTPCSVYRGGTSRGLFFRADALPVDEKLRDNIFLRGIDSYNPSQVDGLGGTTSSTSKVCVVGPASVEGADVDWTFYQLGLANPVVDGKGTCGNLMAAVGAFAIDEGFVKVDAEATEVELRVYNCNIKKIICMTVPVKNGVAEENGDYIVPGIVNPGAKIEVSIMNPGGEITGKLLPLGAQTSVTTLKKSYDITLTDLINPFVFVAAGDLGLSGAEASAAVAADEALIEELNTIRDKVSVKVGIAADEHEARYKKPNIPKIAFLAPAQTYVTQSGEKIQKEQVDILCKVISSGKLHKTCPASGLYNIAATCLVAGTMPNRLAGFSGCEKSRMVRVGHPGGVVEVVVKLNDDLLSVSGVGMDRTARRIMKGEIYTPEE